MFMYMTFQIMRLNVSSHCYFFHLPLNCWIVNCKRLNTSLIVILFNILFPATIFTMYFHFKWKTLVLHLQWLFLFQELCNNLCKFLSFYEVIWRILNYRYLYSLGITRGNEMMHQNDLGVQIHVVPVLNCKRSWELTEICYSTQDSMTALKIKITEMSNKDIKQTWNFVFLFKIAGLSQLIHHTCNYWYVLITIIQYIII